MTSYCRLGLLRFLALGCTASCLWQATAATTSPDDVRSKIAGVWRGHSVCEDKTGPCHDEVNVYRFSSVAGHPDTFSVTASKVVDRKEIVMGTSEWKYDEQKHIVASEKPSIQLAIEGDKMEGALTLEDGRVYRRIYLKKES